MGDLILSVLSWSQICVFDICCLYMSVFWSQHVPSPNLLGFRCLGILLVALLLQVRVPKHACHQQSASPAKSSKVDSCGEILAVEFIQELEGCSML